MAGSSQLRSELHAHLGALHARGGFEQDRAVGMGLADKDQLVELVSRLSAAQLRAFGSTIESVLERLTNQIR